MFVFKTIIPLLTVSDFFLGPKEKMDLGWACIRLIYVVSVLEPESKEDNLIIPIKKVLTLCLPQSPTSIASLMILNVASIGKFIFIYVHLVTNFSSDLLALVEFIGDIPKRTISIIHFLQESQFSIPTY